MEIDQLIQLISLIAASSNPAVIGGVIGGVVVLKGIAAAAPNHPVGKAADGMYNVISSPFRAIGVVGKLVANGVKGKKPVVEAAKEEKVNEQN